MEYVSSRSKGFGLKGTSGSQSALCVSKRHLLVRRGIAAGMLATCEGRFGEASTAGTSGLTDGLLLVLVP